MEMGDEKFYKPSDEEYVNILVFNRIFIYQSSTLERYLFYLHFYFPTDMVRDKKV